MLQEIPTPGCSASLSPGVLDCTPVLQSLAPLPSSPLPPRSGIQAACLGGAETLDVLMPLSATWCCMHSRLCPIHHGSDELPEEGREHGAVLPHPQPEVCDHLLGGGCGTQGPQMCCLPGEPGPLLSPSSAVWTTQGWEGPGRGAGQAGGTWSFRLRPVCSFPAVSPMSSWGWREARSRGLPACGLPSLPRGALVLPDLC